VIGEFTHRLATAHSHEMALHRQPHPVSHVGGSLVVHGDVDENSPTGMSVGGVGQKHGSDSRCCQARANLPGPRSRPTGQEANNVSARTDHPNVFLSL
jgi:hypothetical protein